MTLKRSPYTGYFAAQCDVCLDVMDFENEDNFMVCTHVLRASGWRPHKEANGRWTHTCKDCEEGK